MAPDEIPSRFNWFGGYYSVLIDGTEFIRFAPSPHWSDFAKSIEGREGWSYVWVSPAEASTTDDDLLREAYDLLRNARTTYTDPGLSRQWGRDRRKFSDAVIEKGLVD